MANAFDREQAAQGDGEQVHNVQESSYPETKLGDALQPHTLGAPSQDAHPLLSPVKLPPEEPSRNVASSSSNASSTAVPTMSINNLNDTSSDADANQAGVGDVSANSQATPCAYKKESVRGSGPGVNNDSAQDSQAISSNPSGSSQNDRSGVSRGSDELGATCGSALGTNEAINQSDQRVAATPNLDGGTKSTARKRRRRNRRPRKQNQRSRRGQQSSLTASDTRQHQTSEIGSETGSTEIAPRGVDGKPLEVRAREVLDLHPERRESGNHYLNNVYGLNTMPLLELHIKRLLTNSETEEISIHMANGPPPWWPSFPRKVAPIAREVSLRNTKPSKAFV